MEGIQLVRYSLQVGETVSTSTGAQKTYESVSVQAGVEALVDPTAGLSEEAIWAFLRKKAHAGFIGGLAEQLLEAQQRRQVGNAAYVGNALAALKGLAPQPSPPPPPPPRPVYPPREGPKW